MIERLRKPSSAACAEVAARRSGPQTRWKLDLHRDLRRARLARRWFGHRRDRLAHAEDVNRRELIRLEMRKREMLYGEFIGDCAKLLVDAFTHALEKPETLLPLYALTNRIRLAASPPVLAAAERLLRRITDQYFSTNLTLEEVRAHRALGRRRSAEVLRRGLPRGAQGDARARLAHRIATKRRRFAHDSRMPRPLRSPTSTAHERQLTTMKPIATSPLFAMAAKARAASSGAARGAPHRREARRVARLRPRRLCDPRAAAVGRRAGGDSPPHRRPGRSARGRLVGQLRRPGAVGPRAPRRAREPRRQDRRSSACAPRAPARRSAARC